MATVRCDTCAYWSPSTGNPLTVGDRSLRRGQCRRYPPFMARTEAGPRAQWPLTIEDHWCGEHGEVQRIDDRMAAE